MAQFFTNKGPIIATGIGVLGVGIWGYRTGYPANRDIYMSYFQIPESDGYTVKRIEEAFRKLQDSDESKSLLKKHFTEKVKDRIKFKKTRLGASLYDIIRSGVDNLDSGVGVYAADMESYKTFAPLFDPIIEEYHLGFGPKDKQPPTYFGEDRLTELEDLDPEGKYILSTRIRCGRTLQGYPFNPLLTRDDYLVMEEKIKQAFDQMKKEDADLEGTYYPLEGMSTDDQNRLTKDHFLFKEGDRFLQKANACKYWPLGRGIYHNNEKTFLVWVNEEDHLRIISMQNGGNVGQVLERLIKGVKAIETKVPFSRDDRLGWLTFCPTNLGTTVRASVHIRLPKLSAKSDFKTYTEFALSIVVDCLMVIGFRICDGLNLQIRGIHGEHSETEGGVYDISNKARLGLTEFEAVKQMYDGVRQLIELEKSLDSSSKE